MHHIREDKHGARSSKQAIAIGLSKARRAGVKLAAPTPGKSSEQVRHKAKLDLEKGKHPTNKVSAKRSRAVTNALQHEGRSAASTSTLKRQGHQSASKRSAADRSAAGRKAARTREHMSHSARA